MEPLRRRPTVALTALLLCLAALACSTDSAGPPTPPPPPPPPPPAPPPPTVSTVTTNTIGPSRLAIRDSVLYWVDAGDTPFHKLPLGSGSAVGLFRQLPPPEREISDGADVYWIGGAQLYRTTLDGSATILLDEVTLPARAAVMTMDADYVYWVTGVPSSSCSPVCQFAIRRVPKTGGAATTIATTAYGVPDVTAIAVAGAYVFWEEEDGGPVSADGSVGSKIQKVASTGGTVSTVVDGRLNGMIPPPSGGFLPASWSPRGGIVADTGFVYFADADFFQSYRIMAAPVSGGTVDILLADTTHTSDFVRSMTDDGAQLYWVDDNDVRSMPKAGGAVTGLATARPLMPRSLTRVGSDLYWIEARCCASHDYGRMYTIPTAGGTPAVVHDSLVSPLSVASDGAQLYWIEGSELSGWTEGFGGMRKSALDGTGTVTLIESAGAGPFAVDASNLYFANRWTIKSVPITGGTPRRIAIGEFYIKDVATDGQRVYWLEDGNAVVRSVAVDGGPSTALGVVSGPADRMRIDATYVYWLTRSNEIHRVPKSGGPTVPLIGPISGGATDFAIDAGNIYISGWDSGTLYKMPIGGGTLTPLAGPGLDQTRRIEVDGGKVYWIDQLHVASVTVDGLTQVPIHSGFLSDAFSSNGLAFDGQSVFWTEVLGDAIRKATPK